MRQLRHGSEQNARNLTFPDGTAGKGRAKAPRRCRFTEFGAIFTLESEGEGMRGACGVLVGVALVFGGQPAVAQDSRYGGEWTGQYLCGQGVTAIRLVVVPTGAGGARAVGHFFPTAENPRVPEGCWALTGLFDQVSGEFSLRKAHWIVRPRGYAMVDLSGRIDAKGEVFGGRLSGVKNCTTFSLTREPVSLPMPPRCAAAAQ
jgi:hypothetical protein